MAVSGPALQQCLALSGARPQQQNVLLAIMADNYGLVRGPAGDPLAIDRAVPSVAFPVKGTAGLRQRLAADMYQLRGQAASNDALASVMNMLDGQASAAFRVSPALRIARQRDGLIALDLGRADGAAVLLGPGGWQVTGQPDALFRRSNTISELPLPVRGGTCAGLMRLVNLRDRDHIALYAACRVVSLIPGMTRPVELMIGQPGTGKTGTARVTVKWLGGHIMPMQRDPRDWAAIVGGSHVIGHDNVSGISADRSDWMCRAASGDTWAARALYSDDDLLIRQFQPVSIILNGVEVGQMRGDLIRRSVLHDLVTPERYLTDRQMEDGFTAAWPDGLGWLCETACAVLARLPGVRVPDAETMPDFAAVALAVDGLWGTAGYGAWKQAQEQAYADLVEGDPVALAIEERILDPFRDTVSELLERLRGAMPAPRTGGRWTPRGLSAALDRCQAALQAGGWTVVRSVDAHAKSRLVTLIPPQASNGHLNDLGEGTVRGL
jgi:hypothetical protein